MNTEPTCVPQIPDMIGGYRVIERIATGGTAEILLAKRIGPALFEKEVVIKRLLPRLAGDAEFTVMLQDEARLAALLNHQNIVQVHDCGDHEGSFYIVMEYLIGEDISTIRRRYRRQRLRMPFTIAARLVATAACALDYAHNLQDPNGEPLRIVHRDVSPQNIIVTREGQVKVVDFGIAKADNRHCKTNAGIVKGKILYMPPEQLLCQDLDHRVDVFALGVTLFELVAGTRPISMTVQCRISGGAKEVLPRLRSIVPDAPAELDEIIAKATAFDRDDRYARAVDLQTDLELFLQKSNNLIGVKQLKSMMTTLFGEKYPSEQEMQPLAGTAGCVSSASVDLIDSQIDSAPHGIYDTHIRTQVPVPPVSPRPLVPESPNPDEDRVSSETHIPAAGLYRLLTRILAGTFCLCLGGAGMLALRSPSAPIISPTLPVATKSGPAHDSTAIADAPLPGKSKQAPQPTPSHPKNERHPVPKARSGRMSLSSEVPLRVYVDGKDLGVTPLERVPFSVGQHKVRLINGREGISKNITVELRAGAHEQKHIDLQKGTISVFSEPPTDVYLANRKIGKTPLQDVPCWEGEYTLVLVDRGLGIEHTQHVKIKGNQNLTVRETLRVATPL